MLTKKAIILLGGKGTRLSGLFPDLPKALVPVAGRPFLAWQLDWLFANNIKQVLLAAGYMGDKIRDWVRQQSFKDKVSVSIEPTPLGTGGALKYLASTISSNRFLTLNGDSLLPNLDYQQMEEAHRKSGALATIAVTSIEDSGRYGAVLFDNQCKIIKFEEKKNRGADWINAGIYLLEPAVLSAIGPNKNVSLENEVFPSLAAEGKMLVFQAKPPLLDMGTPEGLKNMEKSIQGRSLQKKLGQPMDFG
jgi:NDP-sugar pyrophosphorylase family protein